MGFSKAQILVIFVTSKKLADKQNENKIMAADNENSQFSPLKGLSAGVWCFPVVLLLGSQVPDLSGIS